MFEHAITLVMALTVISVTFALTRQHAKTEARLWNEIHRLSAVVMLQQAGPVASAVYQAADPEDERSDWQRIEDSNQYQSRDINPLGL